MTHNKEHKKIYNSKKWKLTRNKIFGVCAYCGKGIGEHIDHIVPLSEGGAPYDQANLQPLHPECHAKKTRKEQQA